MSVLAHEQDKYRRMWAHPAYRQYSPGEQAVATFLGGLPWKAGDSLVDLGCGTGRAGAALAAAGLRVQLLDFCRDAVEVAGLTFIEAVLWALPPGLPRYEWIYCVDVLEHIPPEYVDATLDGMADLTLQGGYLQIACTPDGCGALIGERLHLTVQPPAWWRAHIARRWTILADQSDAGTARFLVGAAHAG